MKKYIINAILSGIILLTACIDLKEEVYSEVGSNNFIQSKTDIIAFALRAYDHAYWSIRMIPEVQENMADQWVTYTRNESLWYNGGKHVRSHQHTWTWDDDYVNDNWNTPWAGIVQINNIIDVMSEINPGQYGMAQTEFDGLLWGNRTLRAWFYIRLLDMYRNIPLYKSVKDDSQNTKTQVAPQEIFNFIESELLAAIETLPQKSGTGGNGLLQQQWNKAGAAALLVRLYLNAEKWTGTAQYDKCATYAQYIINGTYGTYNIDDEWDEPFKWDNNTSEEIIYAFASNVNYSHYHYTSDMYWWALSCGAVSTGYFLFSKEGDPNFRYALTPGMDVDGVEYSYSLGKPIKKFQKYPSDYRLKLYNNLGNGEREGMFLFGYIPNKKDGGRIKQNDGNDLYLRDQAGFFNTAAPGATIADKRSGVEYADDNSGWRLVKYPFYPDSDADKIYAADYAEIRLAEIYYSLAECKLRGGDALGAGDLLNTVRKRNYPASDYATVLYQGTQTPMGNVTLDMEEMLDEWGREFIGEMRRRTDLCRFGRFTEAWWDKPQSESFREILPISRTVLSANPQLKQNPGYDE
jgi:hypothetical protein